jgi:hypothetical protein
MDGRTLLILLIAAIALVLAAGCTTPAPGGTQDTTVSTTMVTAALPITSVAETTFVPVETTHDSANVTISAEPVPATTEQTETTPEPSPVVTTGMPSETPNPTPAPREIYYGNIAIFMDREGYALVNFEDIGYPILYPGDKFIVRITADHAILAYVIRTYDTPLLRTSDGLPTYNKYDRTYDYGRLSPILKLENIYDGGSDFTVKDLGKYTLVLDTRLSSMDYRFVNEVTTVSVRILKVE